MTILERELETGAGFLQRAEQAGMGKIVDFRNPKTFLFKHSFTRNGPLVFDDGPGENNNIKVANPDIDRLTQIFRFGIVAADFAKKVGIPVSRNWSDRKNEKYISLLSRSPLESSFYAGALAATHNKSQIPLLTRNLFTLLLDPKISSSRFIGGFSEAGENLKKDRIGPRFFLGIVFIDDFPLISLSDTSNIQMTPEGLSSDQISEDIVRTMLEVNIGRPDRCIPVYGRSGDLYWPRRLHSEEVKDFVKQRQTA